ncbi:MAG: TlpA disulfide reductase family protein [Leptothrix sp. (in: b-proteobacteria)]
MLARLGAGALAVGAAGGYAVLSGEAAVADAPYTLLDGSPHRLHDLRGQVVLVDFWATTCAICLREMPQLIATHRRFAPRGLQTLAVAMAYDPPARVIAYAEQRALPFGVVIDNLGAVARAFGPIEGTPTTLLLDRRGAVALRQVGAPDFTALHARIEQLLAQA